jgi:hypothetical protein
LYCFNHTIYYTVNMLEKTHLLYTSNTHSIYANYANIFLYSAKTCAFCSA